MDKTLLLLSAAGFIAFTAAATSSPRQIPADQQRAKSELVKTRETVKKIAKANADNDLIWKAGKMTFSWWNGEESHWNESETQNYKYDEDGRVISSGTEYNYTELTYNEFGQVATASTYMVEDGVARLVNLQEMEYDSKVHDFLIKTTNTGEWYTGVAGTQITRNEDGNVVSVRDYWSNSDGEINFSSDELVIKYGADGYATELYNAYRYADEVEIEDHITDVTWHNTDGQIFSLEFDDYNSDLFFGRNRIASCTAIDEEWPLPATLTVSYDGISYHSLLEMTNGERLAEFDYKSDDAFGSFTCEEYEVDYDSDDEDGEVIYYIDYARNVTRTEKYDRFGLKLVDGCSSVYHYEDEEDETYSEYGYAAVNYDEEYGYPLVYIWLYKNEWDEAPVNQQRIEYSDYQSFSGVENVETDATDATDATEEYYNLNGIRVSNPTSGLYIVRQGNRVAKRVIR